MSFAAKTALNLAMVKRPWKTKAFFLALLAVTIRLMRVIFYGISFCIGLGSIGLGLLGGQIQEHYQTRSLLVKMNGETDRLKEHRSRLEGLIEDIRQDPNVLTKLGKVTLGIERPDSNQAQVADITESSLLTAKQVLEESNYSEEEKYLPKWVERINAGSSKAVLFGCGSALIFVSFMCFGPGVAAKENSCE